MTWEELKKYLPACLKQPLGNSELATKIEQLEKQVDFYKRAMERTDRIEKCLNQEGQIIKLQEQLRIATEALKYYTMEDSYVSCFGNPVNPNPMVARKALKEIELVGTSAKGEQ